MTDSTRPDAIVVGAGPNGLTAAIILARAGLGVTVLEAEDTPGGGCRTESLTLPGYHHDVCAAIHPMGAASPIFRRLPLESRGVAWLSARFALAHPLADGRAAVLSRRIDETITSLGRDGERWRAMVTPFLEHSDAFFGEVLRPIRLPRHIALMTRFGALALQSAQGITRRFSDEPARALFSGSAAHAMVPLADAGSASFGLVLSIAGHAVDWPCARGGSGAITKALATIAMESGCTIVTGVRVTSLRELPPARAVLFDVPPRELVRIAADALAPRMQRQLLRFRYGPGVFKVDYALSAPIPWRTRVCDEAATVHVGSPDDIARAEAAVNAGVAPEKPFVLVAQQSHIDDTRAPTGHHTGWAYCHVPHGSDEDMTDRIERQIEAVAPGFRDVILSRHVMPPRAVAAHNRNMIGGDIGGGANTLRQFLMRPTMRWDPYTTGNPRLYLCSASTPPGGGVHGMCGYGAARSVLRRVFGRDVPTDLAI